MALQHACGDDLAFQRLGFVARLDALARGQLECAPCCRFVPCPLIAFRNFALRRGTQLLLSDVDLAIHAGSRVGVIGRNGCGKSSLFAAVQGEIEADKGDVDVSPKLRIASVDQQTPPLRDPAIQFVLAGDAEVFAILQGEAEASEKEDWDAVAAAHQKLAEINGYDASARAGRLLHGLGFTPEMHELPVSDFSGGWRARLNLA